MGARRGGPAYRFRVAFGLRQCVGGAFDGRDATPCALKAAFIEHAGRTYSEPREDRALYIVVGDNWMFAGHGTTLCGRCGAVLTPEAHEHRCGDVHIGGLMVHYVSPS